MILVDGRIDEVLAQATSSLWEVIRNQAVQSGQWSWRFESSGAIDAFLEKNLGFAKPLVDDAL